MVTDQGLIQGCAAQLLRQRRLLAADHVAVLADVLVKHALPLAPLPVPMAVQDTLKRGGADGVIVSGDSTGTPVDPEILQQARKPQGSRICGPGRCDPLMGVGNDGAAGGMGMGSRLGGPTAEGQDAAANASEQQGCLLATGG